MDNEYGIIDEVLADDCMFEVKIIMRKEGDIELDIDTHGNDQPSLADVLFTFKVSEDILLQQYYRGLSTEVDDAV